MLPHVIRFIHMGFRACRTVTWPWNRQCHVGGSALRQGHGGHTYQMQTASGNLHPIWVGAEQTHGTHASALLLYFVAYLVTWFNDARFFIIASAYSNANWATCSGFLKSLPRDNNPLTAAITNWSCIVNGINCCVFWVFIIPFTCTLQ